MAMAIMMGRYFHWLQDHIVIRNYSEVNYSFCPWTQAVFSPQLVCVTDSRQPEDPNVTAVVVRNQDGAVARLSDSAAG